VHCKRGLDGTRCGGHDLVREHTAAGVEFRRARIVSEPLADYIRFEYESAAFNIAAGEQVRWLPRHATPGLLAPLADFWLFDDRLVRFGFFAGTGRSCGMTCATIPG
jgi:hypothetical protein